jgi:Ca2+-transporting ATPase
VAGQILHALSCRSERKHLLSADTPPPNKYLTLAVGGSLVLQVLTAIIPGLRSFLGITPIGLMDAAVVGGSALLSLAANETTKTTGR